jgi:ribonucleoside-triphosphate reductase
MFSKLKVIKSNGNLEDFNSAKLRSSILKAYEAVNISPAKLDDVMENLKLVIPEYVEDDKISSAVLGDLVEKALIQVGDFDVAKAFILYR